MKIWPFLILLGIALACTEPTSNSTQPQPRISEVNRTHTAGPITVTVTLLGINESGIAATMKIRNTGTKPVSVYPDQGSIVIGSSQLDANGVHTEGDVSGEIHPGVEKAGTVIFENKGKLDPNAIKRIDFKLGEFYDAAFKKHSLDFSIDVP